MERLELIEQLNALLLADLPEYRPWAERFPMDLSGRRRLLRSLMNLRPPAPLSPRYLELQDRLLSAEREERGVVDAMALPQVPGHPGVALWQGDITRLKADAIVNAANSALLGCFHPCHGCIDNAIHSAAGLQLREECHRLMEAQGHPEPTGSAKLTAGYNLPARHVVHTVGPIISGPLRREDRDLLASCYRSCLELAARHRLRSVAFCCISTGEFHFPGRSAAAIALDTVGCFLARAPLPCRVVFNVFSQRDLDIYTDLLS